MTAMIAVLVISSSLMMVVVLIRIRSRVSTTVSGMMARCGAVVVIAARVLL